MRENKTPRIHPDRKLVASFFAWVLACHLVIALVAPFTIVKVLGWAGVVLSLGLISIALFAKSTEIDAENPRLNM